MHQSTNRIHMCCITHSCVWQLIFTCAAGLITIDSILCSRAHTQQLRYLDVKEKTTDNPSSLSPFFCKSQLPFLLRTSAVSAIFASSVSFLALFSNSHLSISVSPNRWRRAHTSSGHTAPLACANCCKVRARCCHVPDEKRHRWVEKGKKGGG